jgi:ketosteroid isomerase-like protein
MATSNTPSTAAVAAELVKLCRQGANMDAINTLYSPDIVSIEPIGNEAMPAQMTGIDKIRGKNQWWYENNEVHSAKVNGPFIGEDQFAVEYAFETTHKPTGKRAKMTEVALYTVKDGKIVTEQFFYNAEGA